MKYCLYGVELNISILSLFLSRKSYVGSDLGHNKFHIGLLDVLARKIVAMAAGVRSDRRTTVVPVMLSASFTSECSSLGTIAIL